MSGRGRPARRPAVLLLTLIFAMLALPALAGAQQGTVNATLPDIEDEVMCPICGTALNLAESPQAERERAFIRTLIDQGLTKQQIKDRLVAEYGPTVLAVPSDSGFDLTAWVVPIVGVLAAAIGIGFGARRWRRDAERDRRNAPADPGLEPAEEARLQADLGRYEL